MVTPLRTLAALAAFIVLAALAAGCGDGVPGNAVARVDDAVIKRETFDHWMQIAARSSRPNAATKAAVVPKPPDFKECIAEKRKLAAAGSAKGQPKTSDRQYKTECKQDFESERDQVMSFLISDKWLTGEADDLGVKVSDQEIEKEFQKQKKQSFPKEKDFQIFLAKSGYTLDDLKLRVRQDLITNKIRTKVQKGKGAVTQADIAAYYKKNLARFKTPENRDLQVVLTKTKAKADQARSRIAGGESFKAVAKAMSIDQASKSQGGKLPSVIKGQQEKAFDDAIFAAKRGVLTGPVKTQFGYYVFRVTKVSPAKTQSLAEARKTIQQLVKSDKENKALTAFVQKFEKKWKSRTDCRKGYVVASCKSYKQKSFGTTGASGAQQAPAQQQNVPPAQSGG